MDAWQSAKALINTKSAGKWLRLKNDSDTQKLVFLGQPYTREVAFIDGKAVNFTQELKQRGEKARVKVSLNVALFPSREVKVLECSSRLFNTILELRAKYNFADWVFELKRRGPAGSPDTQYVCLPEKQLSPEEKAEYAALELIDLAALYDEIPF